MKAEECPKVDECYKVNMVLDKDMEDFQYAQCIREVCARCPGPTANREDRNDSSKRRMTWEDMKTNREGKGDKPRASGSGRRPNTANEPVMRLQTRVFNLYQERYGNLTELARGVGISVSQIYRVRKGKRPINEKFITGTIKAFPGYKLDDLFCAVMDEKRDVEQ